MNWQRLLFLLALVHGLLYAVLTPPWQGPDEIAHFEYAHLLARHGRPLTFADASPALEAKIIASLYAYRAWDYVYRAAPIDRPARLADAPFFSRSRTLARFSLAYVPYALAVHPILNQSLLLQLYVMRAVSVLLGAVMVVLIFRFARLAAPATPYLAHGAAALVLWLPQHTFIFATVSDGNLAEVLASVCLYQMVNVLAHGLTWRRGVLGSLAGVGAMLCKATTYFLIPLFAIVALEVVWRWYRSPSGGARRLSRLAVLAALVVGALVVPAIPLLLLPVVSVQPLDILARVLATTATPAKLMRHIVGVAVSGQLQAAVWYTYTSFWGTFGWMAAPLPRSWYAAIAAACAVSGLGWALRRRAASGLVFRPGSYAFMALAAGLGVAVQLGWFVVSLFGIYGYQGRYLFGAIMPIAVLLAQGWWWWVAPQQGARALALLVAGLVLFDTAALALVVAPFFHG